MSNFLINTDKKLKKVITELQSSKHLGVDTEFIRESTYYPILALLQISTQESIFCIDVLEIKDKAMLKKILLDKKILKIMHSSKQDLEVLNRYFKSYPINVFDTQIAANLIGIDMNIGYAGLVKKFFNKDLKQGSWRTNWLERPLSDEKLEYACNDVKYLIPIYKNLVKDLKKNKRLDWFNEEQNNELRRDNVITKPKDSWKKINISSVLTKTQTKKLKFLSEWRESKAIKTNLPKRWVLLDKELIKLVLVEKKKINEVLNNLKKDMGDSDKKSVISMLNKCSKDSQKDKTKPKNNKSNQKIKECYKLLEKISLKYKIPQALIANKREVDMYGKSYKQIRFMEGWRFKIFGKLLQ